MMKQLLLNSVMFFLMVNSVSAQEPNINFGNYVNTDEWPDWNIFSYTEKKDEIYAFNLVYKNFSLQLFDTKFKVKAFSKTKIKSGFSQPVILNVRKNPSQIDAVIEEGNDVMHYTFDINSLQNIKIEPLFETKSLDSKPCFTEVCWSPNGEYLAIVACQRPSADLAKGNLKYTDFNYCIYLYNKDFQLLKQVVFPYMKYKKMGNRFCLPTWTITDKGEVVYAALHCTSKPKKYTENGESGCRIEAKIITKDEVRNFTTTNVEMEGLLYRYYNNDILLNACGNIAKYDGETMQIFFSNILFKYDFKHSSVTPLCKFQYYQPLLSSTGLSECLYDGNGGYAMSGQRGWVWIKEEPLNSRVGSWGSSSVQTNNAFFFPRLDAFNSQVTFFHNNLLYHIDNIDDVRFMSRKYKLTQLLCIDGEGNGSNVKITSDAKNELIFYHIDGSRYLVWERNAKINKQYMQRFGIFAFE